VEQVCELNYQAACRPETPQPVRCHGGTNA